MWKAKQLLFSVLLLLLFSIRTQAQDDDPVVYDTVTYAETVDSIVDANIEDYTEEESQYQEDTFVSKTLQYDSTFQDKYKSSSFVYTDEIVEPQIKQQDRHFNIAPILDILLYVILGAAILFLLYFLFNLFGSTSSIIPRKEVTFKQVSSETPVYAVDETDFVKLIAKAKAEQNYKLAIRYYFLLYLKTLAQKGIVKWNKDKTNQQYKREIKDSALLQEFAQLANQYEWVWYGEMTISEALFSTIEREFNHYFNSRS